MHPRVSSIKDKPAESRLMASVIQWRAEQLARSAFTVERISFSELENWRFHDGLLQHDTGGFFSVVGHACDRDTQPFILQPEIGILGFLLERTANEIKLLVQAKTEPGNCGGTQLSPSFQCTESNYRGLHGGPVAPFRSIFAGHNIGNPISDSLQSEQGTRFVDKYNRNTIIEVDVGDIDLSDPAMAAWRWLTISEIGLLLTQDLIFNTDARSVIATASWRDLHPQGQPFSRWRNREDFGALLATSFHTTLTLDRREVILAWLSTQRAKLQISSRIQPLNSLPGWRVTPEGIEPLNPNPHSQVAIRYYRVHAQDREVASWTQPLVTSDTEGRVLLVAQEREGILRFALNLSVEPGFANLAQLSATYQTFPGEIDHHDPTDAIIAQSKALAPDHEPIIFDCRMSEEGGRVFQDINRYLVLHLPSNFEQPKTSDLLWLTLAEIEEIKQEPGVFTNEFRSLLSLFVRYI